MSIGPRRDIGTALLQRHNDMRLQTLRTIIVVFFSQCHLALTQVADIELALKLSEGYQQSALQSLEIYQSQVGGVRGNVHEAVIAIREGLDMMEAYQGSDFNSQIRPVSSKLYRHAALLSLRTGEFQKLGVPLELAQKAIELDKQEALNWYVLADCISRGQFSPSCYTAVHPPDFRIDLTPEEIQHFETAIKKAFELSGGRLPEAWYLWLNYLRLKKPEAPTPDRREAFKKWKENLGFFTPELNWYDNGYPPQPLIVSDVDGKPIQRQERSPSVQTEKPLLNSSNHTSSQRDSYAPFPSGEYHVLKEDFKKAVSEALSQKSDFQSIMTESRRVAALKNIDEDRHFTISITKVTDAGDLNSIWDMIPQTIPLTRSSNDHPQILRRIQVSPWGTDQVHVFVADGVSGPDGETLGLAMVKKTNELFYIIAHTHEPQMNGISSTSVVQSLKNAAIVLLQTQVE